MSSLSSVAAGVRADRPEEYGSTQRSVSTPLKHWAFRQFRRWRGILAAPARRRAILAGMTRDDLIAIVAAAPRKQRLRLVLQVLPTPAGVIARRAGLGRATLYRDEGRLSLSSKLRIARAVR